MITERQGIKTAGRQKQRRIVLERYVIDIERIG